jgi:tRNA modification GTPase
MTFNHYHNCSEDTIAAIATAPGPAAISLIRISGKESLKIAKRFFSGKIEAYKSHTVHFGKILDLDGKIVDSVLLTLMIAPHSYTGEDSIEVSCHGGMLITKKVYETIIKAGARPANPGEFTLRAFLNKKIDLVQAEAVQALISASNELALKAAERQLEGALSNTILSLQKELIDIAAIIEAWVDFPEEDLEFLSQEELIKRLKKIKERLEKLAQTFYEGKILFEGTTLAIIGTPNVGKSSLMNALCQKERSIVTPIPGTTRDTVEEKVIIGELHCHLIDTAGIRKSSEPVEEEGIKRSKKAFSEADLILLILDASRKLQTDDLNILQETIPEKTIVIWNKIDLVSSPPKLNFPHLLHISVKEELGLDELKQKITNLIWKGNSPSKEEAVLTKVRHKNAIEEALKSCLDSIEGMEKNLSAELIASDVRHCLNSLSSIIGHEVTEDILSSIFSRFCIGK